MKKLIPIFVTSTAASMTAIAAWDRGGTILDKALLVALSIVIILAVHLLPALSRRPSTWMIWIGCLFCAIYGHLTFLTHASLRAAETRAQQSVLTVGTERQIEATREALAGIKARPVAQVAAELAQESDRRVRAALREEIAEGRRAEALRDDLVRLSAISTTALVTGTTDPVTSHLAVVTGWSESTIMVIIGMLFSILLELIGALLWFEALRKDTKSLEKDVTLSLNVTKSVTHPVLHVVPVTDVITDLRTAISNGHCRVTVASIRQFMGCSQSRAMELRRILTN